MLGGDNYKWKSSRYKEKTTDKPPKMSFSSLNLIKILTSIFQKGKCMQKLIQSFLYTKKAIVLFSIGCFAVFDTHFVLCLILKINL